VLTILACASAAVRSARADDGAITVVGTGQAEALPTEMEINLQAAGKAELTADAIVKYRAAVGQTLEAYKSLGLENLQVEERTLSIGTESGAAALQVLAVPGGAAESASKAEMNITRSLRLTVRGIDQMPEEQLFRTISQLLDTARDVGATIASYRDEESTLAQLMFGGRASASTSAVTFVVADAAAPREQAYRRAFEEAQERAGRLASLARAELGAVLSIEEIDSAAPEEKSLIETVYGSLASEQPKEARLTSDKLGPIPVRATLRVKFALVRAAVPAGRASKPTE
jgi:uncharacterized protein YggE